MIGGKNVMMKLFVDGKQNTKQEDEYICVRFMWVPSYIEISVNKKKD